MDDIYIKIPFYHVTHIDNLKSILNNGIYSRNCCKENNIQYKDIAEIEVLSKRVHKSYDILNYVPLYFTPITPLLYDSFKKYNGELALLEISKEVIVLENSKFTNGNFASNSTEGVFGNINSLKNLDWKVICSTRPAFNNKRDRYFKSARMSEVLVYNHLHKEYIKGVYLSSNHKPDYKDLSTELGKTGLEKDKFPYKRYSLSETGVKPYSKKHFESFNRLRITRGDIFGSQAHAIVNPVNCVGKMGAGLALEYKNRFPDMFKEYEVKCDNGEVLIGKPYPYYHNKNEKVIINFATKMHYRSDSKIESIVEGLEYFVRNYRRWGIYSVAFPALGTGKGNLAWMQVKPIMINYLSLLDIDVEIYEPI